MSSKILHSQQEAIIRGVLLNELKNEIQRLIELASSDTSGSSGILTESSITDLCAIVDACLLYGLKTDFMFKTTFDLLKKLVIYNSQPLRLVIKQVQKQVAKTAVSTLAPQQNNMLWIQISIMNCMLSDIVECIITHGADQFYMDYSLVASQFDSRVFHSLLAGLDVIKFTSSYNLLFSSVTTVSSPTYNNHPNQRLVSSPYNKKHSNPRLESFISPIFNRNRSSGQYFNTNKSFNTNNNNNNNTAALTSSAKKRDNIKKLCVNIETRILSRVFYEWLNMHRKARLIKSSLAHLVLKQATIETTASSEVNQSLAQYLSVGKKLDHWLWSQIMANQGRFEVQAFHRLVYTNGVQTQELRRKVWPYLLGLYRFEMSDEEVEARRQEAVESFERVVADWKPFEQYKRVVDEYTLNNTINSLKKAEKQQNLLNTTPIKPQPVCVAAKSTQSVKEDDSGICSDLTNSNSYSSSSTNSSANPLRSTSSSNNSSMSNNTSPTSLIITEEEEETSKKSSTHQRLSSLFDSLRIRSHSKSRADLLNLRLNEDQSEQIINSDNSSRGGGSSSLLDTFSNAKTLISKFMHRENAIHSPEITTVKSSSPLPDDMQFLSPVSSRGGGFREEDEYNPVELVDDVDEGVGSSSLAEQSFSPTAFYDSAEAAVATAPQCVLDNKELFDQFAANMHRIDKDVVRCDRSYWFFSKQENLDKLKNVIYSYVWENIKIGYIQGMCDLIAPILVVLEDESCVLECFKQLMKRMTANFIHSSSMDKNFTSLHALMSLLDNELFTYMNSRYNMNQYEFVEDEPDEDDLNRAVVVGGNNSSVSYGAMVYADPQNQYTSQFYFTYRWFLLDFKRELLYADIFTVWETIWSARHVCTEHFSVFVALALITQHRNAIIDNHLDFTDIIQYFNELSEKHNVVETLRVARELVKRLQDTVTKLSD